MNASLPLWLLHPEHLQPFHNTECESLVKVWPSSILGLGFGLFVTKDVEEGEVVCVYTGVRTSYEPENWKYTVEADWSNPVTGVLEKCYLDASSLNTASGRWVNDACDYEGVHSDYVTGRKNNINFKTRIEKQKHSTLDQWYIKMYAIVDIPAGSELFVRYGVDFWKRFRKEQNIMY